MRAITLMLGACCLAAVTACEDKGPTSPTVPLNQQFTLGPGQTAVIEGTSARVQFLRVSGDSRCPADAICVWGGDALVHVRVMNTGTGEYELHTGDSARAMATHEGLRIELKQLQPYPFSGRTIAQDDYRATLQASRP